MNHKQFVLRLSGWLNNMTQPTKYKLIDIDDDPSEKGILVLFWTTNRRYSLTAFRPCPKRPKGYLGAGYSNRAPNPGETWTRGNDIGDGAFSKTTFNEIMVDIANHEFEVLEPRQNATTFVGHKPNVPKPTQDDLIIFDLTTTIHKKLAELSYVFGSSPTQDNCSFFARKGAVGTLFRVEITLGDKTAGPPHRYPEPPTEPSIIVSAGEGNLRQRSGASFYYVIPLADPECLEKALLYIRTNAHAALKEINI